MAAILAEIGREEPFCIGQALAVGTVDEGPGLLPGDHSWSVEHGLDVALLHFRGPYARRPSWLHADHRSVTIAAGGARLVQAIPASEGPDAVPADQAMARAESASLALAPGRYLCRGIGDSDRLVWAAVAGRVGCAEVGPRIGWSGTQGARSGAGHFGPNEPPPLARRGPVRPLIVGLADCKEVGGPR
jgi:hypothetical protein